MFWKLDMMRSNDKKTHTNIRPQIKNQQGGVCENSHPGKLKDVNILRVNHFEYVYSVNFIKKIVC